MFYEGVCVIGVAAGLRVVRSQVVVVTFEPIPSCLKTLVANWGHGCATIELSRQLSLKMLATKSFAVCLILMEVVKG